MVFGTACETNIGLFQKKPAPPWLKGFWKFSLEGVKDSGNPGRRGVELEKAFCRDYFDR